MDDPQKSRPAEPIFNSPSRPQTIVVQQPGQFRIWLTRILVVVLMFSLMVNFVLIILQAGRLVEGTVPEQYHSGDRGAQEKIALINVSGTIMPPFTKRYLKSIKQAAEDEDVKGVLLVVDSPGGLVSDSHQIYHRLQELAEIKPVYVAMQRMAASGGYYIAMGAGPQGKIYVEPTTWTGSIGVIIPRYDFSKLAERWDVKSDPLKTGPFKDALSPFRELSADERAVWDEILDDAFQRFITVIAENRESLDAEATKKLATGQIYTADQALANGMVDKIGYEDDALNDLKIYLGLETVKVVSYQFQPTLMELLSAESAAQEPGRQWQSLLDATVPRAMYYCSWAPGVPGW